MKLPEYPLKQLQEIKKRRLEEAEKVLKQKKEALAQEQEKLKAEEQKRDKVLEHKQAKLDQLREELDRGTTSDKVQSMKQYLKIVDEDLKQKEHRVQQQKKQVEQAEKQVEEARKVMLQKQQDVEKINLHYEEWVKEMRLEIDRSEGRETAEMGSSMHHRNKGDT